MARRRKGNDVSGWVIVDKPAGPSSSAIVNAVRRAFDARKAGHAGTLDPAATGLLAVALGEATKTVPCLAEGLKTYRFCVRFGQATSTDDAEGAVLRENNARPDDAQITAALARFRGDIMQVPPQVSAVKVEGARAYARARAGEQMELAARPLHVARLELLDRPDPDHAILEMVCGKGGYVRAIARDLGAALGCLGHAAWLRRTATGPFDLSRAVDMAQISAGGPALEGALLPIEAALADLPRIDIAAPADADLRQGRAIAAPGFPDRAEAWAACAGRAVALGRVAQGQFHPRRVLAEAAA